MPRKNKTLHERFFGKVKLTTGCWIWEGSRNHKGYGHMLFEGRVVSAHRISWTIFRGTIPNGLHVLHDCPAGDNPSCVNPYHLFTGTNQENLNDMKSKGRSAPGERRHNSKLTESKVRAMRESRKRGTPLATIAEENGITISTASSALNRKTWKHVL